MPRKESAMAKTEMIRARVEPELKEEAEAVFDKLGLSPTEAVTLFYRQVALHRGIPFELRVPNATTRKAIVDARRGKGLSRRMTAEEMIKRLG
jgi:DNA-damage-inducible protein J